MAKEEGSGGEGEKEGSGWREVKWRRETEELTERLGLRQKNEGGGREEVEANE